MSTLRYFISTYCINLKMLLNGRPENNFSRLVLFFCPEVPRLNDSFYLCMPLLPAQALVAFRSSQLLLPATLPLCRYAFL